MGAPASSNDVESQVPLVSPHREGGGSGSNAGAGGIAIGIGSASGSVSSSFAKEFVVLGVPFKKEYVQTVQLGVLFAVWYLFNILFNIYNKQVLKVFRYPLLLTCYQFLLGSIFVIFVWTLNLYKRPNLSYEQLRSIFPLAVVHVLGNSFTNMSIGSVAVSFTHTVKALEPFFSVVLAFIFMGDVPNVPVVLSLFPIVIGVALASITETSFNWTGFLSAMASNLMFQSRNVLSKKLMIKKDETLDNINLFSVVTLLSFIILSPFIFILEDYSTVQNMFFNLNNGNYYFIVEKATLAAICFHSYQQVSYIILQRVSVVTHSVGNCMKRVVVIISAVIFFDHPISLLNASGTAVALAGVFGYSQVKARNKS